MLDITAPAASCKDDDDPSTETPKSKAQAAQEALEAYGKDDPLPEPFVVKPSALALCRYFTGDLYAACLMVGLLELWVNTKRLIKRPHEGGQRGYLFLSVNELIVLTGLTARQLSEKAIPRLAATGIFEFGRGRVTPNGPNKTRIFFDNERFWRLVLAWSLKQPLDENASIDGVRNAARDQLDRDAMPIIFRKARDRFTG